MHRQNRSVTIFIFNDYLKKIKNQNTFFPIFTLMIILEYKVQN